MVIDDMKKKYIQYTKNDSTAAAGTGDGGSDNYKKRNLGLKTLMAFFFFFMD